LASRNFWASARKSDSVMVTDLLFDRKGGWSIARQASALPEPTRNVVGADCCWRQGLILLN